MTPQAIVDTAVAEGLDSLRLPITTKSRTCDGDRGSRAPAVTVIPGVELSTPQGHLLFTFDCCFAPEFYRR